MAKFSVGRLEDDEGPSSSRKPKRPRRANQPQTNLREEIHEQQREEEETHEEYQEFPSDEDEIRKHDEEYQEFLSDEDEIREHDEEYQEFPSDEDEIREHDELEEEEERGNSGGNGETADPVGPSRNGPFSLTLTDPEVFDCPICYEPLTTPVFQCENGHIACSTCCTKLRNKCPSCCSPIGYNRCRAIEKVLESVKVICQNTKYGCKETMSYCKIHDHEKTCPHEPYSCPLLDCNFVGSSSQLYKHFIGKHKNSALYFSYNRIVQISLNVNIRFLVLQEERDGVLFILNNCTVSPGNVISVSCIAPSWKAGYYNSILARPEGSSFKFQSFTKNIKKRVDNPTAMGSVLVPVESFGSSGDLKLDICIYPHQVQRVTV